AMMRDSEFRPARKPDPSEWRFEGGQESLQKRQLCFRGKLYWIGAAQWMLLQALALADGPVGLETLADAIYADRPRPTIEGRVGQRVAPALSVLKRTLQREFDLPRQ